MNMTDAKTYQTTMDEPFCCVGYPCVDGWRARPVASIGELLTGEGEVLYIKFSSHNETLESANKYSSELKEVIARDRLAHRRETLRFERCIKLLTVALLFAISSALYVIAVH